MELDIEATVIEMEQPSKEKTPAQWHQTWQKEMDAAEKRTRKYKKQGTQVVKRYLDDREGQESSLYFVAQHRHFSTTRRLVAEDGRGM